MNRSILLCLCLMSSTLHAQQHSLIGVWQVRYAAAVRNMDGVVTPIMATGTLKVEGVRDSLVGTLVADSGANMPSRPPLRLAALSKPGEVVFLSQSKATLNMNGESQEATVISTWTLGAKGDSLSGTVVRSLVGIEAGPQEPQPVTGHRRKS
jgi:hypothetical protein